MPSEYFATVKLEPFYQRFLCHNFKIDGYAQKLGEPFVFPPRHDLSTWVGFAVGRVPPEYRTPNYGDSTFRILIPNLEHKNPECYNYIGEKRQRAFRWMIHRLLVMLFHNHLKWMTDTYHYSREYAIDELSARFGFIPDDYDRLIKEYQRWLEKETKQRYKTRKQMRKEAQAKRKKNVSSLPKT